MNRVLQFLRSPRGAVTVDWVVLSGALIGMAAIMIVPVATSTTSATEGVRASVTGSAVGYSNAVAAAHP